MKTSYLFFILLLSVASGFAQEKKCADFRTGNFHYSKPEYKRYKVSRTETLQTETDSLSDLKLEGSIKWTSECNYELTYTKISDPKFDYLMGQKISVEIIKILGKKIFFKSEGAGVKIESEMIKTD